MTTFYLWAMGKYALHASKFKDDFPQYRFLKAVEGVEEVEKYQQENGYKEICFCHGKKEESNESE